MFCNFIIKDDPLLFEAVQLGWPCMHGDWSVHADIHTTQSIVGVSVAFKVLSDVVWWQRHATDIG